MKKAKGYYSKAARSARSVSYRERVAMRAASRLMGGAKRKYVKSGKYAGAMRRKLFKALPFV